MGREPRDGGIIMWLASGVTHAPAPEVHSAATEEKRRSRSDEFVDGLKAAKMGPFSRHRALIMDHIEVLIGEKRGEITVADLIEQVIDRMRAEANGDNFPFRMLREFLNRWPSLGEVLEDREGKAIRADWTGAEVAVHSLHSASRRKLDGIRVIVFAEQFHDITLADDEYLAGARYNGRDHTRKVRDVISYLLNSEQVFVVDGALRMRRPSVPAAPLSNVQSVSEGVQAE